MTLVRRVCYTLLVCLLLLPAGQSSAETNEYPRYDLELRFDPDAGSLTGSATIAIPESAVREGRVRLNVETGDEATMNVGGVVGPEGRSLTYDGPDSSGVLQVTIGNDTRSIRVSYSFDVDTTHLEPFGYYIFASAGKTSWAYPQLERADSASYLFADFNVAFDRPSSLSVLTSGGEGESRTQDGRTVTRAAATHIEAFVIVAGEGFEVIRREMGGVAVVAFYHPDFEERFDKVVKHTQEAAAWYRKTYGFFPLDQVCIIQGHPHWGGGFPMPNVFGIHLGNLESEHLVWITAHEVGHYYFGLHVLGEDGNLDWLQLALGIWCDQLYLAERNGLTLPEQWRDAKRQGDWFADYLHAVVADFEQRLDLPSSEWRALDFDYNSLVRHGKAATGIFLESILLGRDRFLEFQRQLLQEYRHRPLPVDEFVTRLQDAGLPGARDFFDAWIRGDAMVGVNVDDIEPDGENGGWRVNLRRTGSVPYPVAIEVDLPHGEPVRHVMPADRESDTIRVAAVPERVRIDPDGIIPMWNSAHPGIRGAFVRALERAGHSDLFLSQARDLLDEIPEDDYLRYRLIRRLFWLANWDEAAALWPKSRKCGSRDGCVAAVYAARALHRLGQIAEAKSRLEDLKQAAEGFELTSFWEQVWGEFTP